VKHGSQQPKLEIRLEGEAWEPPSGSTWRAELDGSCCRSEREFLLGIASALDFPEYYGRNWDAFFECFGDLLEVTEGGMGSEFGGCEGRAGDLLHLVVQHAEDLLVDAVPRDFSLLLWKCRNPYPRYDPPQPWHRYADLRVTFVCDPRALASFGARFDAAEEGARHLW
jgi:Barstar (barnase inhibitor)